MLPFGAGIDVNLHGVKFQRATLPGLRRSFGGFLRRADKRSEEHTSELQSQSNLVCRLLLEKKKNIAHHSAVAGDVTAMPTEHATSNLKHAARGFWTGETDFGLRQHNTGKLAPVVVSYSQDH